MSVSPSNVRMTAHAANHLQVAERVSKIREQVLEMLADLPYRIQNVNSLTELYKERGEISQGLHKKSSDLYVAILEAVSLMLGWLNTKGKFRSSVRSTLLTPTS